MLAGRCNLLLQEMRVICSSSVPPQFERLTSMDATQSMAEQVVLLCCCCLELARTGSMELPALCSSIHVIEEGHDLV